MSPLWGSKYSTDIKLGDLLVQAELLSQEDQLAVLKLAENRRLHIGQLLVMGSYLTSQQLQAAIDAQSAIRDKVVELNVALRCLKVACSTNKTFDEAVKADAKQTASASRVVQTCKLGEMLVAAGVLTPEDVERSLKRSLSTGLPLGRILVLEKLASEGEVSYVLAVQSKVRGEQIDREQALTQIRRAFGLPDSTDGSTPDAVPVERMALPPSRIRLSELLVLAGILTNIDIVRALELGLSTSQSVAEVLIAEQFTTESTLEAALALQAKVDAGEMDAMDAIRCLSAVHFDGKSVDETMWISEESALPPEMPFAKFLAQSGLVTFEDISNAFDLSSKSPEVIARVLLVTGFADDQMMNVSLHLYEQMKQGRISEESALSVIEHLKRNGYTPEGTEALDQFARTLVERATRGGSRPQGYSNEPLPFDADDSAAANQIAWNDEGANPTIPWGAPDAQAQTIPWHEAESAPQAPSELPEAAPQVTEQSIIDEPVIDESVINEPVVEQSTFAEPPVEITPQVPEPPREGFDVSALWMATQADEIVAGTETTPVAEATTAEPETESVIDDDSQWLGDENAGSDQSQVDESWMASPSATPIETGQFVPVSDPNTAWVASPSIPPPDPGAASVAFLKSTLTQSDVDEQWSVSQSAAAQQETGPPAVEPQIAAEPPAPAGADPSSVVDPMILQMAVSDPDETAQHAPITPDQFAALPSMGHIFARPGQGQAASGPQVPPPEPQQPLTEPAADIATSSQHSPVVDPRLLSLAAPEIPPSLAHAQTPPVAQSAPAEKPAPAPVPPAQPAAPVDILAEIDADFDLVIPFKERQDSPPPPDPVAIDRPPAPPLEKQKPQPAPEEIERKPPEEKKVEQEENVAVQAAVDRLKKSPVDPTLALKKSYTPPDSEPKPPKAPVLADPTLALKKSSTPPPTPPKPEQAPPAAAAAAPADPTLALKKSSTPPVPPSSPTQTPPAQEASSAQAANQSAPPPPPKPPSINTDAAQKLSALKITPSKKKPAEAPEPAPAPEPSVADTDSIVDGYRQLADNYRNSGDFEKAQAILDQILSIKEEQMGKEHSSLVEVLDDLVAVMVQRSLFDQAEATAKRMIELSKELNPVTYADSLNTLARLYFQQELYEKCEPMLLEEMNLRRQYAEMENTGNYSLKNMTKQVKGKNRITENQKLLKEVRAKLLEAAKQRDASGESETAQ